MADEAGSHGKRVCMVPERARIHMALTFLQSSNAVQHIVIRSVLNMGVNQLIFPVYRSITALLLLFPFAYFLERKDRPPLNISLVMQFFLLGLIGVTCNQGFYLLGLENTSATFVSAVENAVPAGTFLMAAVLRIEQVHLNRKDGKAKVLGVLASVAGASVITFYKGPTIYVPPRTSPSGQSHMLLSLFGDAREKNWTFGCICAIGHCVCWFSWIVLQGPVLKKYPARLSVTSFTLFFGILQLSAIAAYVERDSQEWQIHSGSAILGILYVGVVASAMSYAIQLWAIDKGGPVFVSVYMPLQTLLVDIMDSVIMGAQFYLGGIVGAVLIVAGLYLVVWGKSKESKFGKEMKLKTSPVPLNIDNQIKYYSEEEKESSLVQPLLPTSSK
ncbi:protein WALLS ARE THIN 1-like [Rosa rugosa]|uniref:protein WALLS ARE THIN 1-like n=1 Tax=Rosa rugosa TaxID=74645 RepID=UPI002B410571|nr:protein WALLS ARE THIN 1-like [Rosa rugosa]